MNFIPTPILAAGTICLGMSYASASVLTVPDYSVNPDGTNTSFEQLTDVATPNGGNVLPSGGTSLAFAVTTFTFGVGSDAHLIAHFVASLGIQQDRVGISIDDDGFVSMFGIGPQQTNSTLDLNQDMAGQTVNLLMKFDYDVNRNATADDTFFEAWINPTSSSTEGASDIQSVWNSASFPGFIQRIDNQSTPGSAGASSISNTRIFTGADATFANAFAAIPEPSSAVLLGLSAAGLFRRRRR
jgi:hypothetical protein